MYLLFAARFVVLLVFAQSLGKKCVSCELSREYLIHSSIVEFLTHPDNITVLNGTEVKFSCVAVEADLLSFFVDSIPASEQSVIDKGFVQLGTEDIDSTTTRRNLTATALTQYNNTKIQCVAFDIGNAKHQLSDNGSLLVQGKLSLRLIFLY